jgi:hypothetical protein
MRGIDVDGYNVHVLPRGFGGWRHLIKIAGETAARVQVFGIELGDGVTVKFQRKKRTNSLVYC